MRAAVTELAEAVDGDHDGDGAVDRRAEVTGWLASWPEHAESSRGEGRHEARIVVLTGLDTKGLEFDGIVVVQPEEIERESVTGRATLYVVLTRATQRMSTITV